jgi:hypothetical protein
LHVLRDLLQVDVEGPAARRDLLEHRAHERRDDGTFGRVVDHLVRDEPHLRQAVQRLVVVLRQQVGDELEQQEAVFFLDKGHQAVVEDAHLALVRHEEVARVRV